MLNITIARNRLLFRYRAAVASAGCDDYRGTTADPQVAASLGSQYLIVGVSSDLVLWSGPIEVTFSPETYANNMSVLVSAHQYLAFGLMYPSSVVLVGPFNVPTTQGS